jgi:hypothetical protein
MTKKKRQKPVVKRVILLVTPKDAAHPRVLGDNGRYIAAPWWPVGYVTATVESHHSSDGDFATVVGWGIFEPLANVKAWFPEELLAAAVKGWKSYYGASTWKFWILREGPDQEIEPLKISG